MRVIDRRAKKKEVRLVVNHLPDDDVDAETEENEDEDEDEEVLRNESTPMLARSSRFHLKNGYARYSWKTFSPKPERRPLAFLHWLVRGFSQEVHLTEEQIEENFRKLARMLLLLREYEARFGLPEMGGSKDQQYVLQELCCHLYAGGVPIWSLQPVLERASFGLIGSKGVNFSLFPRSAFLFASGATTMFQMERGFYMHKTTLMEQVLIRLASFGTNTETVNSLPGQSFPDIEAFSRPPRGQSVKMNKPREQLAEEILDLASEGTGLFFYTHSRHYPTTKHARARGLALDDFWHVEDSIKQLFRRLAAIEAEISIDAALAELQQDQKKHYPVWGIVIARVITACGASGLWFGGSWIDMFVAGCLAMLVASAQGSTIWKHERFIFEVIICFMVGMIAGFISLMLPYRTCFGAMAVASIIDILQGFKLVYAVMELMSKHTVAGGADFMEAFLFTGLMASFLKVGQFVAMSIVGGTKSLENQSIQCVRSIDEGWYFIILPVSTMMWAYSFMPRISDIWSMAWHGILSFSVYYGMSQATGDSNLSTFVAASAVTFSAGIVSRFTGRQALGDTVTGLYALVPGAYLARGLFEASKGEGISGDLMYDIIVNAVLIGIGAWSGTILCQPTILGTNRGLINQNRLNNSERSLNSSSNKELSGGAPMLFF